MALYATMLLFVAVGGALVFTYRENYKNSADSITSAGSLSISGGGQKTVGDTFNMTASIEPSGVDVCVIEFTISYPADKLELKSSSLGSTFGMVTEQSITSGSIHYMLGAAGCTSSSAAFLTMTFNAKAAGNATVSFSNGTGIGNSSNDLSFTKSAAIVNISSAGSTTPVTNSNPAANSNTNSTKTTSKKSSTSVSSNANTNSLVTTLKDPTLSAVGFSSDVVLDAIQGTAKGIVFSGTSDADAKVNLIITSDPITVSAVSDSNGNWTYTLTNILSAGIHTIAITAEKNGLTSQEIKSNFVFAADSPEKIALGTILPNLGEKSEASNSVQTSKKTLFGINIIYIIIAGAVAFLTFTLLIIFIAKRNHYLKVSKELSGSLKSNISPRSDFFEPQLVKENPAPINLPPAPTEETNSQATPVNSSIIPPQATASTPVKLPPVTSTPISSPPVASAAQTAVPAAPENPSNPEIERGFNSQPQENSQIHPVKISPMNTPITSGTKDIAESKSQEPEITFDGGYTAEDFLVSDDNTKKL